MFLFSKNKKSYLGVDVGSANVKMVELGSVDGKAVLKNFGFAERKQPHKNLASGEIFVNQSAEIIKSVYAQSGFETKHVVAALHNFDVFTSVINLPPTPESQLASSIQAEARKFVPILLEDVILDWKVLNKGNDKIKKGKVGDKKNKKEKLAENMNEGKGIDVLLTAAPRKLVKRYLDIFQAADLNLLSLETESFALIRSLLDSHEMSSLMIMNIGSVSTDVIIVEEQIPVVIRTVDVGGNFITQAIARNLGISEERAEQFKRDVGIYNDGSADSSNNALNQIVETSFSTLINEIKYSLELYKTRNRVIEKIILSGGSALLSGLTDFFKTVFNLPVFIGDPWYKVSYPAALQEGLKELGPTYATVVGLALKEIIE
jgi:type IV pilus assembly protein PilM